MCNRDQVEGERFGLWGLGLEGLRFVCRLHLDDFGQANEPWGPLGSRVERVAFGVWGLGLRGFGNWTRGVRNLYDVNPLVLNQENANHQAGVDSSTLDLDSRVETLTTSAGRMSQAEPFDPGSSATSCIMRMKWEKFSVPHRQLLPSPVQQRQLLALFHHLPGR